MSTPGKSGNRKCGVPIWEFTPFVWHGALVLMQRDQSSMRITLCLGASGRCCVASRAEARQRLGLILKAGNNF